MSRFVITTGGVVTGTDYNHPSRPHKKGDVVELNAAEQATLSGAGIVFRAATVVTTHDQLGEAVGVSNGS